MVKKIVSALVISLLLIPTAGSGDISRDDIDRAINKDRLSHPYLRFTDNDKPAIRERIANDPDYRDVMAQALAEANRLMYTPVEEQPPLPAPNPRFNTDWGYENFLLDNTRRAHQLAFVYQITGEEKYAQKAFEFIRVVCNMPTLVHGAHKFEVIYDRVWPWNVPDDQPAFGYSQWMDHLVFQIADVYDWLYTALDKRQRDQIRGALLEKAILPVRGAYEYHWWATAYRCNWCAVCNSSLGMAALTLLTEDPQLSDVVAESYNRIYRVFDEIRGGGWQEGMGYMSYCLSCGLTFTDALNRLTGGKYNLYEHPELEAGVLTFIYGQFPGGKSVHFGDAGGGGVGSYQVFNDIMLETGNRYAAWLRENLTANKVTVILDILKPKSTVAPVLPSEVSMYYPAVDWVIMRSDFTDPDKVSIVGKSGLNDDPHHGHLDQGHFSLYWRGVEFISDHGSAGYDRKYFDKERWDYPLASSIGHNTVIVNGEKQLPCKIKNEPWNFQYGGKVVEFRPGTERDYSILDPTNAYPKKELKKWRRHLCLDKPVVTVVLDEIESADGAEIEVRYHSAARQDVRDAFTMLKSDAGTMAVIPVSGDDWAIKTGKHAILMAQKNASLRWTPYFGTVLKARGGRTVVATIILPVDDDAEAQAVSRSAQLSFDSDGNVKLAFTAEGERHEYRFSKMRDGLVLE